MLEFLNWLAWYCAMGAVVVVLACVIDAEDRRYLLRQPWRLVPSILLFPVVVAFYVFVFFYWLQNRCGRN